MTPSGKLEEDFVMVRAVFLSHKEALGRGASSAQRAGLAVSGQSLLREE